MRGIAQEERRPALGGDDDTVIRLRLVRAEYDDSERGRLLKSARRHQVPGLHAALISAREARRCCLESRAEEALESWRDAVSDAIHAGTSRYRRRLAVCHPRPQRPVRAVDLRLDEEHRLAQALRTTGTGRLLDRIRDPREEAMSATVSGQPREAVLAARRWLTDSVATGSWADEQDALVFLADLYRDNREPLLAASYYQRAGDDKKLLDLASQVGDLPLPIGSLQDAPWWTLSARAALISVQADLLDDRTAEALLAELTGLAVLAAGQANWPTRRHAASPCRPRKAHAPSPPAEHQSRPWQSLTCSPPTFRASLTTTTIPTMSTPPPAPTSLSRTRHSLLPL